MRFLLGSWISVVVVVLAVAPLGSQELRHPLVDRAIDVAGKEALESATVSLTVSSKSGSFDVVVDSGPVFRYQVTSISDGETRVHTHTNDEIILSVDGAQFALDEDGQRRAADFVSQRVYFLFLPYRLNDPSVYKLDRGLETWDGRRLHRVRITFEPGTSTSADSTFAYWFDPETAELVQFAYSFDNGLRLRKLVNRREIGGIQFTDQENWAVTGKGLDARLITPDFASEMELLSVVKLSNIKVQPREG